MDEAESKELNLADVLRVLRRQLRILIAVPTVLIITSLVYLHTAMPRYTVTLQVTPTTSATSTLPTGISNLAGLTGIALPSSNESMDFELYLEGLQSRETSAAVAKNSALLQQLFPDEWDAANNEWSEPSGLVATTAHLAKTILGFPGEQWVSPDAARVNELLDEELRIIRDRNGPVVTIVMEHEQPQVAQRLLASLHETVDSALRQKELDRTGAYVNYLREQLSNVSVTEYRQALHEILAEQEKRRMVASSNLPFAAEPFGQPTVSARPTSPQPVVTLMSSLFLGALLGIVAALARQRFSAGNDPDN